MKKKNTTDKEKSGLLSIKVKISLLCAAFIIIASVINFTAINRVTKTTITSNTQATMKNLADSYSKNMNEAVNNISNSAQFLMQSKEIKALVQSTNGTTTADTSSIDNYISMFLNMDENREDVSLVSTDGTILYSSKDSLKGTNISSEDYFKTTLTNGTGAESDVFVSDTSNSPSITFAIPFRNIEMGMGAAMSPIHDNISALPSTTTVPEDSAAQATSGENSKDANQSNAEVIGMITVTVKASAFSSLLSEVSLSGMDTAYAYLLDTNGNVI